MHHEAAQSWIATSLARGSDTVLCLSQCQATGDLHEVARTTVRVSDPLALGMAWLDGKAVVAAADGRYSTSLFGLAEGSGEGVKELKEFERLRPARRVDLQTVAPGDVLVATTKLYNEQVDVQVDRLVARRLTCQKVDESKIPVDRCADGDIAIPPQDMFLATPQTWHCQAAGLQLMSRIPVTWTGVNVDGRQHETAIPDSTDVHAWAIGPLVLGPSGLAIARTNLYVASPAEPDPQGCLQTDTLLALSRCGDDIGVLLNQTRDASTVNDEDLRREWTRVLDRRALRAGLTLRRELDNEGKNTFHFFRRGTNRPALRRTPWNAQGVATGHQLGDAAAGNPDQRILPYDEWVDVNLFAASEPADTYTFEPSALPASASSPGAGQDVTAGPYRGARADFLVRVLVRMTRSTRSSSSGKSSLGPHPATLLDGKSAGRGSSRRQGSHLLACTDRRHPRSWQTRCDDFRAFAGMHRSRVFRPQGELAGLCAGHSVCPARPTPAGRGRLTHALQRRRPVGSRGLPRKTLDGLARLTAKWNLTAQPLSVHDDARPLTKPTDDNRFLQKQGSAYVFKDVNRRVFALVSLVANRLLERLVFQTETERMARFCGRRRDAQSDNTLPLEFRDVPDENDVNHNVSLPRLYLVTRVDNLVGQTQVGLDETFVPKLAFFDDAGKELTSLALSEAFTQCLRSDGFFVWQPKASADRASWWTTAKGMEIRWEKTDHEDVKLYPWSSDGSNVGVSKPVALRPLDSRGAEPTQAIVLSENEERKVVLAFEHVGGPDVTREELTELLVRRRPERTKSQTIRQVYSRGRNRGDSPQSLAVQIAVSLALGECLGGEPVRQLPFSSDHPVTEETPSPTLWARK